MPARRAIPCWIAGCICPRNGSPTRRMRNGARQCGIPPDIPSKPSPSWPRRCSRRWSRARHCGAVGWWRTRRLGAIPGFLDGVAGLGLWYFAEVPHATRVWGARPATHIPPWRGRGRRPQRQRLVEGAPEARTVLEVRRGAARRGVDTPDDQRRQPGAHGGGRLPPCGWWPCGTPCPVLRSGWCCVGTSRRGS